MKKQVGREMRDKKGSNKLPFSVQKNRYIKYRVYLLYRNYIFMIWRDNYESETNS